MNKELKHLILVANKASTKCRWGMYPMAPSIGLSDAEIAKHQIAHDAHAVAHQSLTSAGFTKEAEQHAKIQNNHSWVIQRVGNFS